MPDHDDEGTSLRPKAIEAAFDELAANAFALLTGRYRHRTERRALHCPRPQRAEQDVPDDRTIDLGDQRQQDPVVLSQRVDDAAFVVLAEGLPGTSRTVSTSSGDSSRISITAA